MTTNRQFRLAARPVGMPRPSDWQLTDEPLAPLPDGEVRVRVLYLSLDPAMRGWMNEGKSYIRPVAIGEVMRAGGVGVVAASNSAHVAVGDYVTGSFGVQEYWTGPVDAKAASAMKIDPALAPLPAWLNVLGMPGMTAYFGLTDIGQPKAGETVVVSAAAGAVGATVGQVAKQLGCRAVGIAGGPDKCRYVVEELGFRRTTWRQARRAAEERGQLRRQRAKESVAAAAAVLPSAVSRRWTRTSSARSPARVARPPTRKARRTNSIPKKRAARGRKAGRRSAATVRTWPISAAREARAGSRPAGRRRQRWLATGTGNGQGKARA
jgi:hypothetical protein